VDGALNGGIKRPWLGADGQAVTADIAKSLGLARPDGVLISQVFPGSPAAQAGLVKGDVLLSIDGFAVSDPNAMRYRVVTHKVGDSASIRYWRNGATKDTTTRIALPPDQGREEGVVAGENPMQGARIANITPALADEMQLDMMAKGCDRDGGREPVTGRTVRLPPRRRHSRTQRRTDRQRSATQTRPHPK
jgi:serine protease Do